MSWYHPFIFSVLLSILLTGCSITNPMVEFGKRIWGSSTHALEQTRGEAISQTFRCGYAQCFNAIIDIAHEEEYAVFIKDYVKGIIVVMKIKGSVDTTEVGIFLTEEAENRVAIDVASLSTNAKRIVADVLFPELKKRRF